MRNLYRYLKFITAKFPEKQSRKTRTNLRISRAAGGRALIKILYCPTEGRALAWIKIRARDGGRTERNAERGREVSVKITVLSEPERLSRARENEEIIPTVVQFGSRLSTSQSWKYALFCTRFIQVAYTRLSVGKSTADRILSEADSSGGCSISTKVTLPCTTMSRSMQNSLTVGFVVPLWKTDFSWRWIGIK